MAKPGNAAAAEDGAPAGPGPATDPPTTGYRAALEWLLGFADWERGTGWNPAAAPDEQWKLGRTRLLLELAGDPDRALRCILIAGTKGKGSTAAILESLARAGGARTGLYTQPHLNSYRERVRLDGDPLGADRFAALVERLRACVARLRARAPEAGDPTTFELTTVLALLAFAEAAVDLAILEVGLGGRLDATNAVEPVLSVITPIGLDHTQILGGTIAEIAREKAGIIRPAGRVVSALQRPAARAVIVDRCRALGADYRFVRPLPSGGRADPSGQPVRARVGRTPAVVRLALLGAHQRQNAAVALAVARALVPGRAGLAPDAVREGLARARVPGRVEILPGSPTFVLDAAHNVDSAAALARTLRELELGRPCWLVLGLLGDKDAAAIIRALVPGADGLVVSAPATPRALPAEALAEACRRAGAARVESAASIGEGLERARTAVGPSGTVVVTGSFAVVAEARAALGLASPDR